MNMTQPEFDGFIGEENGLTDHDDIESFVKDSYDGEGALIYSSLEVTKPIVIERNNIYLKGKNNIRLVNKTGDRANNCLILKGDAGVFENIIFDGFDYPFTTDIKKFSGNEAYAIVDKCVAIGAKALIKPDELSKVRFSDITSLVV